MNQKNSKFDITIPFIITKCLPKDYPQQVMDLLEQEDVFLSTLPPEARAAFHRLKLNAVGLQVVQNDGYFAAGFITALLTDSADKDYKYFK